jgi:hypothetical protein
MTRNLLLACALLALLAATAQADPYRGYQKYDDGWFRGHLLYDGFAWRDPAIAGLHARRPDYTKASSFDTYPLRLKFPMYRDPVHPVHRVATPARTPDGYVWPNRRDLHLTGDGVPKLRLDDDDWDTDNDDDDE